MAPPSHSRTPSSSTRASSSSRRPPSPPTSASSSSALTPRAATSPPPAARSTRRPASPLLYNALIRAHARLLDLSAALALFARMRRSATPPDAHTFACVVRACADCSRPDAVRVVHSITLYSGASSHPVVGSALVSGYAKLGLVEDAAQVFDGLHEPDLVLWNAMISGYGYQGMWHAGLELFSAMRRARELPDGYSIVSLVSCFSDPGALAFAQGVHGFCVKGGYDSGHHVRSALVTMYMKCGCVESARILFHNLPDADLVTWSSLITGLLQIGKYKESFDLFRQMCHTGRRPDSILIASALSMCFYSCNRLHHGDPLLCSQTWSSYGHQSLVFTTGCLCKMWFP
jgi:pentatricopeptide repeat protein